VTALLHGSGVDVDTVMVDGNILVQDKRLQRIDETAIINRAKSAVSRIRKRSQVRARNHMSLKYR
jgi:hypothetical protein